MSRNSSRFEHDVLKALMEQTEEPEEKAPAAQTPPQTTEPTTSVVDDTAGLEEPETGELPSEDVGYVYSCPNCGGAFVSPVMIKGEVVCPECGEVVVPQLEDEIDLSDVEDEEDFEDEDDFESDFADEYEEPLDSEFEDEGGVTEDYDLDDEDLNEAFVKRVIGGRVRRIKKMLKKARPGYRRVRTKSGVKYVRMAPAAKAALRRARRKAHIGIAKAKRARSMRKRRSMNL